MVQLQKVAVLVYYHIDPVSYTHLDVYKRQGYFLPTILTTLGLIFYDAWQLSAVTEEEEERARDVYKRQDHCSQCRPAH